MNFWENNLDFSKLLFHERSRVEFGAGRKGLRKEALSCHIEGLEKGDDEWEV